MLRKSTITKITKLLGDIKQSGQSIRNYCKKNNISEQRIYDIIQDVKRGVLDEESKKILDLYDSCKIISKKNTSSKTSEEIIDTDDRSEISLNRNEDGRIISYSYKIYKRNKAPLTGTFSREEMNTIYRLYSYYGDSLTQRVVARHFTDLSLVDFKRILRAFNITKASGPFASFMYEEHTEEELREIQLREKENSFLRKAEEDQIKNNEKLLKKYAQENIELKKQLENASFKVEVIHPSEQSINFGFTYDKSTTEEKVLNLYVSDIHIGAAVTSGTLYSENINYGDEEVRRRLNYILENITDFGVFEHINVVLLGDNIDCAGIAGRTARLDHEMPENMDPRQQANSFLSIMTWFVDSLKRLCNSISVYSVPCGNHGGNFEYMANRALMYALNVLDPNIKTTLWEKFYGYFKVGNHQFLGMHGKADAYMKKPMPLNLNDKTQILIYEWLDSEGITGDNIHIIKGDLHSNSMNSCKKFTYRNVLSLFGASDYSSYNYSRNSWGMSYDIIKNGHLISGTFENM